MTRATRALIDTAALQHNLRVAKATDPESRIMAIVKADGYGHGMVPVARALQGADSFGVACLDEAKALREAGVQKPIVLLEGFNHADDIATIEQHRFEPVIHHEHQLEKLEHAGERDIRYWLKIDTGMHRLGFRPEQAPRALSRLLALCKEPQRVRLLTHLANADDRSDPMTAEQLQAFNQVIAQLPPHARRLPYSIANSAGLLGWPQTRAAWNRPGIMLYGVSPFSNSVGAEQQLQAVMHLYSDIIAINHHRRGDRIGYGGSWVCPEDMPVGVVAIGYGDGYPRHAPSGTPVLINDKRVPLIGRVSMDMITVDLRTQPHAAIGDPVQLWGDKLAVEEIAEAAGTIAYELLCGVTRRVPYSYQ